MYDHQSLIIHQHPRRTASPQSGTPHPDSTATSTSATGRPMRACSCSSTANGSAVDSAMSTGSPYDMEDSVHHGCNGSSPSLNGTGSFERKRKCEGLDRLPRTPLPTLSSPAHLSSPRPRSATCSSDFLSTPTPCSSICHHPLRTSSSSSCTASGSDVRVDEGKQPSDRSCLDSKRVRRPLQASSSSSLLPLPASSLAARRRSIQGITPSEMAKRPKLEASASTGHLNVPERTYETHMPTHLDLSNQSDHDLSSAPPSASFSNLTITQPSSPAYAAFSLQTPHQTCSPSTSSPMQFAFVRPSADAKQNPSQMPIDGQTSVTCQSRTSDRFSTRHDKTSARSVRRRMRRAASLPLEDEVTIARSQHQTHHRQTSSSLSFSWNQSHCDLSSSISNTQELDTKQDPMAGANQRTERRGEDRQSHKVQESTTSECVVTSKNIASRGEMLSRGSSDDNKTKEKTKDQPSHTKHGSEPHHTSTQDIETPVQMTSAQLAAMHQFNMPKQPRAAPPVIYLNRTVLPPYPTRSQAFAQAQRRLPAPTTNVALASVSTNGSTASMYRPSFLYVSPPPQIPIPALQDQVKPPPTASIPAYMPPITRDTLRELDLQEVLQCRQLRHDVVFDANLMFRPNFDGDRGDRKREAADRYWTAITRELENGCKCTAYSFAPSATARMLGKQSHPLPCICTNAALPGRRTSISERLPSRIIPLIQELRDILLALLPSAGNASPGPNSPSRTVSKSVSTGTATSQMIIDTLDPIFIAQEVAHGVLDVCSLAAFFGQIIKSHCAPMRDDIVESMAQTIKKGGQTNDMSTVSSGLRMCFEILEFMKIDIANHQLRMLRPYLLETAADFEYKTFLHLREKGPQVEDAALILEEATQGPPLTKTKAWIAAIQQRTALPATGQITSNSEYCSSIVDGVLQLLFKPSEEKSDNTSVEKTSQNRQSSSIERPRKPKAQALPHSGEVPETLQLDMYRLQLLHGDIVDLVIVHLLLLLYRQLCSVNKRTPSPEDVEGIRRQIWIIMSEINTSTTVTPSASGRRTASALSQSIKKLESEKWGAGMRDVLLQIARFSSSEQGETGEGTFLPDSSTLAVLNSWMDNNLKPESKLFQLVQTRLRRALSGLMIHEIQSSSKLPSNKPWDMASSDLTPEGHAETDAIIKQNGLLDLTSEVRLLASRISKVAGYNAHVFRELYAGLL